MKYLLCLIICSWQICIALGSDLEREKRLQEQTLAALFTGEPVYLRAGDHDFLALETPGEPDSRGAVILLHGRGYGPDSEVVVGPMREALSEQGWHTLSLQMPVLAKGMKYYDYVDTFPQAGERIEAGLRQLSNQGFSPVILLAHSCGVHMSMDWIRQNGDDKIDGYIGIAMGATDYGQPMKLPFPLADMRVPVLDIYGSSDWPSVVDTADERWQAIEKNNPRSEQIIIADANHEFLNQAEPLIEAVSGWLSGF